MAGSYVQKLSVVKSVIRRDSRIEMPTDEQNDDNSDRCSFNIFADQTERLT